VGKNILIDILFEILEGYTNKIQDTNAFTDRFNGDMMGKLLVVGDEINARAQDICNELKDIITRDTEVVEFKNKDKITIKDYKNYFMTTNNENVFKVSNTDIRYFFMEGPENRKEQKHYDQLVELKKDKNRLKQLYNYFKTRDITKFVPMRVPMTEYKKHLILNNLPAYFRFIKDEYDTIAHDTHEYTVDELYKISVDYARRNRLISTYTDRLFQQQFFKVLGDYRVMKDRKVHYKFPKGQLDNIKNLLEKILI
jgi:hypothetical protein